MKHETGSNDSAGKYRVMRRRKKVTTEQRFERRKKKVLSGRSPKTNEDGYGNSGSGNSGSWNPGNLNSCGWNSGSCNSGSWNSGSCNSGNWNSGSCNSGSLNSGYGNSANRSSGVCCTEEPEMILFDKPTNKKWYDIDHPHFAEFYLTKWVTETEMTDEEKVANPNFFVCGGYLKRFEYKEAWANFWRDTSEENRKKFLALPNFDAEKFFAITGVKVS